MASLIRWALDEAHATTALTKMAEEAGDEVGRSECMLIASLIRSMLGLHPKGALMTPDDP